MKSRGHLDRDVWHERDHLHRLRHWLASQRPFNNQKSKSKEKNTNTLQTQLVRVV